MLILLRHGRTPLNAEGRLQGLTDMSLDDVGVAEAESAGRYIQRRWDVDEVVATSLTRARETVAHAGFESMTTTVDDRWREIDFGDWDERPLSETINELTNRWRADPSYHPSGGESMAAMHERVIEATRDLIDRSVDRNVLVVTHATPIKSAAVWAMDGPISMILNLWVSTGSVTVLGDVRGDFRLREFNTQASELAP